MATVVNSLLGQELYGTITTAGTTLGNWGSYWVNAIPLTQTCAQTFTINSSQIVPPFATGNYYYYQHEYNQIGTAYASVGYQTFEPLTPEQEEEIRKQAEATEKKRVAAKDRARRLLVSILSDDQRQQYEKENSFELQVNGRFYRIHPGGRVAKLDPVTKKPKSHLCIHPHNAYELPGEDWAVSQKLLLESNEEEFLKLANEWAA